MRSRDTQSLSDGEIFYAIERGIPFTAMPAWGNGSAEGEQQSWELVRFIRHLPALTDEEVTDMEKYNPKSRMDEERDRDIDRFLGAPTQKPRGGGIKVP